MEYSEEQWRQEALISLLASTLDGFEHLRIQTGNRAAQATRSEPDKDGTIRGFGLDPDSPIAASLLSAQEGLKKLENQVERELERHMKAHPLGPWIISKRGLGLKTAARLIGVIGDPYLKVVVAEDGSWTRVPRGVRSLYAYCGMHVVTATEGAESGAGEAPRRRRGTKSNWSETARKRLYNIAIAQRYGRANAYRPVYDAAKAKAQAATHATACVRCGPAGKPALAGTPLGGGHAEGRALRAVSKQVLKELWRESRRLHGAGDEDGFVNRWPDPELAEAEEPAAAEEAAIEAIMDLHAVP